MEASTDACAPPRFPFPATGRAWVGPVIAPVLVSLAMIVAGIWCLWREAASRPLQIGLWNIFGVLLGALVIVLSFTLDYRNIMAGRMPNPFHWGVFGLGRGIGAASYARTASLRNRFID